MDNGSAQIGKPTVGSTVLEIAGSVSTKIFVMIFAANALAACVNQAGQHDPYHLFTITDEQRADATKKGLPYVTNRKGNLQTVEPIVYETQQFGQLTILPGFVSDGSSRPFDTNPASIKSAILHDAMYRGTPKLSFENGFPGPWTKAQADTVYCLQMLRLGVPKNLAETNCRGVRFLQGNLSVWGFHKQRRERYWANQSRRLPN